MPVPESDSVVWEEALAKVKCADAAPVAFGVNLAVNETLWPAAIVTGNEMPVSENSESVTVAEETTTDEPEAFKLPVWVALDPTVTLPKLNAPGVTLITPAVPAAPVSGIDKFVLFVVTEILPVTVEVAVGVKVTLSVKLCPDVRVSGSPGPLIVN